MQSVALPPEDGAIAQALADLDAKLSAWTTAMRSAQDALARMPDRSQASQAVSEAATIDVEAPPQQVEPAPAATPRTQKPENTAIAQAGGVSERPSAPQPEGAALRKSGKPGTAAAAEPASPPEAASVDVPAGVATAPAAEKPEEPARSQPSEDEALLATLDEETAKAIRIMRRVDFGRRSVAELLKEYQASRSQTQQSSGKGKSWWSRGKG